MWVTSPLSGDLPLLPTQMNERTTWYGKTLFSNLAPAARVEGTRNGATQKAEGQTWPPAPAKAGGSLLETSVCHP